MRAWRILVAMALVGLAGCGGGGTGATRTVLVDYNHDEFAGIFISFFPTQVTVRQGDTVHFKQAWNGEPHSVTMGTLVDEGLGIVNPLLEKYPQGEGAPPEADQQFEAAFKNLPFMIGDNDQINQGAAQPCYLDSGTLPENPDTPCPKRAQPAFNGRQAYYSSGFITYAGNNGNTFNVKLSDDIKPGTYGFYCNFHGPGMQGKIIVKPKGSAIPSQSTVDRKARSDANANAKPVATALRKTLAGGFDLIKGAKAAGFPLPPPDVQAQLKGDYFAGYSTQNSQGVLANEFLPKTINAKVGEKVTWIFVGTHTISFDVPRYFPILAVAKNGTVAVDKRAEDPVGGVGFPRKMPDNAGTFYVVDGGTWDGSGFRSSGLTPDTQSDEQIQGFSLTFSKAGKYPYACLIHPRMVGTVVVK